MNKEAIEKALLEKSSILNTNLLSLAKRIASTYIKHFTKVRIEQLDFSKIDTKKATRLNLNYQLDFNKGEKELLSFSEEIKIQINEESFFVVDLKGYVIKFVWNNEEMLFHHIQNINDFLTNMEDQMDVEEIKRYLKKQEEELYIKSLIYKYAYILLEEQAKSNIDYARAGMFKNAYFDIIEYQKQIIDIIYRR